MDTPPKTHDTRGLNRSVKKIDNQWQTVPKMISRALKKSYNMKQESATKLALCSPVFLI